MLGRRAAATQRPPVHRNRWEAAPALLASRLGRLARLNPIQKSTCVVLACLAAVLGPALHAVPVDRLASPRPAHWVLDTTGTLSATDIARIDAAAEAARARTGGEIALVVVDSTDGRPAHDFATTLANRWLIGDQVQRNGILILLAKGDRRSEIALAKGVDGEAEARAAREILEAEMKPRFRAGDYAGGLLAAIEGASTRILRAPQPAASPGGGTLAGAVAPRLPAGASPAAPEPPRSGTIAAAWGLATLAVLGAALLVFLVHRRAGRGPRRSHRVLPGLETPRRKQP